MEQAIQNLGITYTDEQINQMAQRHFENTQVIATIYWYWQNVMNHAIYYMYAIFGNKSYHTRAMEPNSDRALIPTPK